MSDEPDTQSRAFKEWYDRNKGTISTRRKTRYDTDPEYRAEVVRRQKEYRAKNPRKVKEDTGRVKEVGGVMMQVFRIGEAAEQVGRDEQTIRGWEEKGIIPKPTVPGVHRNYTQRQVNLMKELALTIDQLRYDQSALNDAIGKATQKINQHWKD